MTDSVSRRAGASTPGATHTLTFRLNGEPVEIHVPGDRLLLDLLRDDLGLTGTKAGCGVGVCGACSVLIDGGVQSACLTLAALLEGCSVVTIEGLASTGGGGLTPLQRSFVEHAAVQCGFCTPGQIVAATQLLEEEPQPTRQTIEEWMAGNLCRCTGYYSIIEAIEAASREHRYGPAADGGRSADARQPPESRS